MPSPGWSSRLYPFLLILLPFIYLGLSLRMLRSLHNPKGEVGPWVCV